MGLLKVFSLSHKKQVITIPLLLRTYGCINQQDAGI
jgi:hypothetical protein